MKYEDALQLAHEELALRHANVQKLNDALGVAMRRTPILLQDTETLHYVLQSLLDGRRARSTRQRHEFIGGLLRRGSPYALGDIEMS